MTCAFALQLLGTFVALFSERLASCAALVVDNRAL